MRTPSLLSAALLLPAGCASAPDAAPSFPQAIAGLGTEPFWNVTLEGDRLAYRDMDNPRDRTSDVARQQDGETLRVDGTFAGAALRATLTMEPCSDGMSDRSYPYRLDLEIEGRRLQGCGYPAGTRP